VDYSKRTESVVLKLKYEFRMIEGRGSAQKRHRLECHSDSVSKGIAKIGRTEQRLSRIFLFANVETLNDGLFRGASADVILYRFNKPQGERRRLFVGMGEDRTKQLNFILWHGTPTANYSF